MGRGKRMRKLISIDYMRAVSMLYIVAFWHLLEYTNAFPQYKNLLTGVLTVSVLGLFVFISGYLVGGAKGRSLSPLEFYKKRIIRIYPLYALAILLFYLYGINGSQTSLFSLLGLSMYYGPKPITLWFITAIVVYYLLAPLFLRVVNSSVGYLITFSVVFLSTIALYISLGTVDIRVALYLPCFAAGIYCSIHGIINKFFNLKSMMAMLGIGIPLLFVESGLLARNQLGYIPLILSLAYLIFYAFYRSERYLKASKIVTFLSYGSFAAYLFHRPIYSTMKSLYFPNNELFQVPYLIVVFFFVVMTISWGLQKTYDVMLASTSRAA